MDRREIDLFEQDIRALLARSLEGETTNSHLHEEILISMTAGELPSGARAGVDAHLVACRHCATQLVELREELRSDEETLAGCSSSPGPPGRCFHDPIGPLSRGQEKEKRLRGSRRRVCRIGRERGWLWSSIEALGVVAIIAVGGLIAWRAGALEFGVRPIPDAVPETTEVLQPRGLSEARVEIAEPAIESALQGMIDDLGRLDAYPAWRAIAYGIGLLNRYGVPLESPVLSFEATEIYIVHAGDTWQSIAEDTLGDEALWPILVLLNREWAIEQDLPEGAVIRIPLSAGEEGGAP
ncbi:hypothetical protein JW848_10495 [Candidatus Bipolaricaulota bacterium]|nr:hypothetical protein [Candidatus Bipolaricaulota bacterium]